MGKGKKKGKKNQEEKYPDTNQPSSNRKSSIVLGIIWLLWIALMYYLLLPAVNLHSVGFWMFVICIGLFPAGLCCLVPFSVKMALGEPSKKEERSLTISFGLAGILFVLFLVILIFGSKMFHASRYASILTAEEVNFTEDLDQSTAISKIALMDTDSAILLGNREIGGLSEVVSQYNVSADYTQIDKNGSPLKVSALNYAGFFKYMGNKENGIPGYVQVDPVGQSADYVALEEGMNYVPSAYFSKDIRRHLRFLYPTKIFKNLHFEVDEDGKPYYIASVSDYTISLFGGETVSGAIVCNPTDGSCEYYDVADIPQWVDLVFDGNLLTEQYNWNGNLTNGFMNSIFGKKGCKKTTETVQSDDEDDESYAPNYGYVSKDGDIWIYTGVTSVNDDASNIGFILVNERTAEAHYYDISGADESSAMSAAEGEVQEKGYIASFPSLVNVDDQPTYVMVLKDASGIVKLYAMVNVESYNKVTTAASLDECFAKYRRLIGTSSGESDSGTEDNDTDVTDEDMNAPTETYEFSITGIEYIDVDGNTYVYLTGDDSNLYKMKFTDNEELIYLKVGDSITAECVSGTGIAYRIKSYEKK